MPASPKLVSATNYKIEKSVPVGGKGYQYNGPRKYPFPSMEVGDSIFVPDQASSGTAANSAHAYGLKHGLRFASRSVEGGVRIWRTA